MKKVFIITYIIFIAVVPAFAQREQTRMVTATGSYVASQNETPAYGQSQALMEAKKQALREAGVTENVTSTAIIVMGGSGNEFREITSELNRIELEGRVRVKEETPEQPVFTSDHLVKYTTTIRAEVVVEETEEDLTFRFKTDGLKSTYFSGDNMTFTVTPTADCYLRIFILSKHSNGNAQIYPVESMFRDMRLKANESVVFPPTEKKFLYDRVFDYKLEMEDPKSNLEQDVLLIVAVKKPYPFLEEVNYESVIRWLSKIKRSEKCVLWQGVNIVRR